MNRLTGRRVGARTGLSGPAGDWLGLGLGAAVWGWGFVPELGDWELGTRVGRSNDPSGGANVPTCPGVVSSLRGRPFCLLRWPPGSGAGWLPVVLLVT